MAVVRACLGDHRQQQQGVRGVASTEKAATVRYSGNGAFNTRLRGCQDKDSAGSGAEANRAEATSATETISVASERMSG